VNNLCRGSLLEQMKKENGGEPTGRGSSGKRRLHGTAVKCMHIQ